MYIFYQRVLSSVQTIASLFSFILSLFLSFLLFTQGPKLFKEPSSKSNKPIIINAIAHCCLAGKVNESQKNAVLEVGASALALIHLFDDSQVTLRCFSHPCRSWKSASRITSSSSSGTAAASSAPSTRTRPTRRRLSSSPARGRVPSAQRWWTSSTSTARTASSSLSSRPSQCRSAWTP